jgi:hypothetical protein
MFLPFVTSYGFRFLFSPRHRNVFKILGFYVCLNGVPGYAPVRIRDILAPLLIIGTWKGAVRMEAVHVSGRLRWVLTLKLRAGAVPVSKDLCTSAVKLNGFCTQLVVMTRRILHALWNSAQVVCPLDDCKWRITEIIEKGPVFKFT